MRGRRWITLLLLLVPRWTRRFGLLCHVSFPAPNTPRRSATCPPRLHVITSTLSETKSLTSPSRCLSQWSIGPNDIYDTSVEGQGKRSFAVTQRRRCACMDTCTSIFIHSSPPPLSNPSPSPSPPPQPHPPPLPPHKPSHPPPSTPLATQQTPNNSYAS